MNRLFAPLIAITSHVLALLLFIDIEYFNYLSESPNYRYGDKKNENNPEEIFMTLTNFYRLIALDLLEVLLTANYMFECGFKSDVFEGIIKEFDKRKYTDYPEILCRYYLGMLWNNSKDESNYYELKELLEKCSEIVSLKTLSASFIGLENFCVKNIWAGNKKFLRELLELYKTNLVKKFYFDDGFMTHTFFRNAVGAGAKLGEFDWTRDFIEKYKNQLQEKVREPVYLYSLAYVETELKNYEKAIKHLSKVKTDEIYLKVAVRLLQCRLFYELNWQEQLNSLVDASKHFLANDKVLPLSRKAFYSGYFKFIYKLSHIRDSGDKHKLNLLKTEIENNSNLHGKDWLLEKINEIK